MDINEILKQMKDLFDDKSEPNPSMPLIIALHSRLGHHKNGWYFIKDIKRYLQISNDTYNRLVSNEFGTLDKVHFRKASEIIIHVESSLTLEERLYEELLYVLENPKQ